jgi:hypothetical protein
VKRIAHALLVAATATPLISQASFADRPSRLGVGLPPTYATLATPNSDTIDIAPGHTLSVPMPFTPGNYRQAQAPMPIPPPPPVPPMPGAPMPTGQPAPMPSVPEYSIISCIVDSGAYCQFTNPSAVASGTQCNCNGIPGTTQ